jgi:peroxiredoxin
MAALLSGCGPTDEQLQGKAIKGQPAPNFMLTDLTGKEWQLSDLRGKVVFINFWATWCPPCIQELPSMEALKQRLSTASFQMLTILYSDRPELGQSMVNKSGYSFPVLIDTDAAVGRQYGLTGVPETFIIDPQGILREKFIGPFDWESQDAMIMLEKYLPQ